MINNLLYKLNKRKSQILLACVLSFILTMIITNWNSTYYVKRDGHNEQIVKLTQNIEVVQEIDLEHTDNILVLVNTEKCNTADEIIIYLKQNSHVFRRNYPIKKLKDNTWQYLRLNVPYGEFQDEKATLHINYKGEDNVASIMLVDNTNENNIKYATINERDTEKSLFIIYNKYKYDFSIIAFIISFIIIILFFMCIAYIKKNIKEYPVSTSIIVIFIYYYIINGFFLNPSFDGWIRSVYLMDYSYGFVNRGLIGSIINSVWKIVTGTSYITDENFIWITSISTLGICCLVYKFYKNIEGLLNKYNYDVVKKMLMIVVFSPFFFTYFLAKGSVYGRLDIFLVGIFMISCYLVIKKKYELIPLLSVVAVCIYQVYAVCFFPIIFLLLLMRIREDNSLYDKIIVLLSFIVTIGTTLYTHLFGVLKNIDPIQYFKDMQARSDANLDFTVTVSYALGTGGETIPYDLIHNHLIFRFVILLIVSIPFWMPFMMIIWKRIKNCSITYERLLYCLYMIAPAILLCFCFIPASDFTRYFVDSYIAFATGVIVVCLCDSKMPKIVMEVNDVISKTFSEYYLIFIPIYGLLLGMRRGTCWPYGTVIDSVVSFMEWISHTIVY